MQVLAASVVEDEVRKALGLTALEIDASKRLLAACHTPEAQGRAERLMDIVNGINRVGDGDRCWVRSGARKRDAGQGGAADGYCERHKQGEGINGMRA